MTRLARVVCRRPGVVVAVWAFVLLASAPLASALHDQVTDAGYTVAGSESKRVIDIHDAEFSEIGRQSLYLVLRGSSDLRLRAERARRVGLAHSHVQSAGRPQVRGDVAVVSLYLTTDLTGTEEELGPLKRELEDAGLSGIDITGQAAVVKASTQLGADDIAKAERISVPVTLLILCVAFLSPVAALVPVALALVAVTVSFALLASAAGFFSFNAFIGNTATFLGLGLSIDYSLFIVSRYRELVDGGRQPPEAIEEVLRTVGRAVLFSGITVAVTLGSLFAIGVGLFSAMAIGGATAAMVAVLAALTLVPAVILLLGHRLDKWSLRRTTAAASRAAAWSSLADWILRRRLMAAAASLAVLCLLAFPITDLKIGHPTTTAIVGPDSAELKATEAAAGAFGPGILTPIQIVTQERPQAVARVVRAQKGVARVDVVARGAHGWTALNAIGRDAENTDAAYATVRAIRSRLHTSGLPRTYVGGVSAEGIDITDRVSDRSALVVGVASVTSLLLLLWYFRSVVIPIKAVATNLLSVAAALGLIVVVFQWLGNVPFFEHFIPILLFALLFALSMDYEIFLLSRVRDEYLAGAGNDDAVRLGLVKSGRPITLAAVIMMTVFLSGSASSLEPVQQVAIGMALAVFIDATVVRCILVPSVMALLGDANWWFPRWLSAMTGLAGARRASAQSTVRSP